MLYESLLGCFVRGSNDYNGVLWTIPYLFWGALLVYLAAYLVGENRLRYITYGVMLLVSLKTDIYFSGIFLGFVLCDFFCTQENWFDCTKGSNRSPCGRLCWDFIWFPIPPLVRSCPEPSTELCLPPIRWYHHLIGAFLLTAGVLGCEKLQWFFSRKPFCTWGRFRIPSIFCIFRS